MQRLEILEVRNSPGPHDRGVKNDPQSVQNQRMSTNSPISGWLYGTRKLLPRPSTYSVSDQVVDGDGEGSEGVTVHFLGGLGTP